MRKVTLELEDESLYQAVEAEAARTKRTPQDIVTEALEQWLAEIEMDERERAQIEEARKEWSKKGGVEAPEFFAKLTAEEEAE